MFKKMSIRLRLTVLSVMLLIFCCTGLTVILNFSANKMADIIEATPVMPAKDFTTITEKDEKEYTSIIENNNSNIDISANMADYTAISTSIAARNHFLHQSVFYMVFLVCIGGLLTYYISGKALLPLKELSSQMKNRTVYNLSEDLAVPESNDEISDLTCSFNEMSHKLDKSFAMQKMFSQNAAHELRTPLTVLKTKVDVFKKKKDHTADEYNKLLDVINTHTNRLSELVKDLLELTNMDALECNETIGLKSLLDDICKELSGFAYDKNISVSISGYEKNIIGNKNMLYRAFYNLVENSIKYNNDNGKIDIIISENPVNKIVTIKDTGIGIPVDMQNLIFEPFFRVDKSRSRQMGGAGLGLSIVKNVIDKHSGKIVISENPKGGTVFEITF